MPIECKTSRAQIDKALQKQMERMHTAIIRKLCYIGEEAVNYARNTSLKGRDYKDQTHNLRSSTGYVVTYDGKIVFSSDFRPDSETGTEGAQAGRNYAEQIAAKQGKGYALIVVAGMNYARYVSAKGYDVLDSAELKARELIHTLFPK